MSEAKRRVAGLVVFTESRTVPARLSWIRAAAVALFVAVPPLVLVVADGRRWFWAGAVAALPMLWLLGGYHLWRRICPLAVFGQLGRLVGRPGKRRASGWLAAHGFALQVGVMLVALAARLVFANGTPLGLVALLAAVAAAAAVTSFVYGGKTWCNFLCPIGAVERIYAEPVRLAGPATSACSPCTACKPACPDIDLEQGYWKDLTGPARRLGTFAWPGLVLGFYVYYWVRAGDWAYYFSGAWTREAGQAGSWLAPGAHFARAVPVVIAAPLTLLAFAVASVLAFTVGERVALARAAGPSGAPPTAEAAARVRHHALALAGFAGFVLFYAFAGQPLLRRLPGGFPIFVTAGAVLVATLILVKRWDRREVDFVEERVAKKLLKRWEWGERPTGDVREVVLLHAERTKEKKERLAAYRAAIGELVADGVLTRSELALLDGLRARLAISDREHGQLVDELDGDERMLFDARHRGAMEIRLARARYLDELGRATLVAARAGRAIDATLLTPIALEHDVPADEHLAAVASLATPSGPLAAVLAEEVAAAELLASAAVRVRARAQTSAGDALLGHLAALRAEERLAHAEELIAALDPAATAIARASVAAVRAALARPAGEPTPDAALVDALLPLCRDDAAHLRALALHVLGPLRDERVAVELKRGAADDDARVREIAVAALTGAHDTTLDVGARFNASTTLERMMLVHTVPMFADLGVSDLEDVALTCVEQRFAAGEALCREGEPGDRVFLLVAGEVEASTGGDGRPRRVLGQSGAGACIGELAVLDSAPRSATVTARCASRALVLDGAAFTTLMAGHPGLAEKLTAVLARHLRAALAER